MIVTEQINGKLQRLPLPLQEEVLDFVEFLLHKNGDAEKEWGRIFSCPGDARLGR